jgi:hypothetical protein
METLSDSILRLAGSLLSNPGFRDSLRGRNGAPGR